MSSKFNITFGTESIRQQFEQNFLMRLNLTVTFFTSLFCLLHLFCFGQQSDSVLLAKPLKFTTNQLIAPSVLLTLGAGTTLLFKDDIKLYIRDERNRHIPNFHTTIDNFLQYAPIPIAYGLDIFGVKSKNDLANRTAILIKGEILMIVTVNGLKFLSQEQRPDFSSYHSFPSGHTAQAFAAATFLSEEYKDRFPWMPYVAYTIAGTTGALRIANNRHFLGDVLFGAGLGILSMKVSYWTHQYKWQKKKHLTHY